MIKEENKSFGRIFINNLIGNAKILAISIPMLMCTNLTTYFGKPINSQEKLNKLIVTESKSLNLDSRIISGKFGETPDPKGLPFKTNSHTAYVHQLEDQSYEIILDKTRSKNALQHELYHIYDYLHTNKRNKRNIFKIITNEIQANFYAATGIKTSIKR